MKRSKFSLSNYKLLTCDMGELVPCGITEVLPGDTIQQATSVLLRVSPLLAPVMHPVNIRMHHWFVPHRLIWDDFEKFITGGADGNDASVYPTIALTTPAVGSLADYLGVPTGTTLTTSALPFRAYALIFNEWYRDQDLVTALVLATASGADSTTSLALQKVAWEKDYFTSARPWTQKGSDVTIPTGGVVPVTFKAAQSKSSLIRKTSNDALAGSIEGLDVGTSAELAGSTSGVKYFLDPNGTMEADLSSATAIPINDLREAFGLQRYKEARARYGSRYTEYLRYLGVKSSDARLQRPEYLGGGKQTIQFSEVLQTAGTTDASATGVADLKGHGIGAMRSNRYRKYFEEHGTIVSMLSVKPKTMYSQGIQRMWNRRTKEDFFQKELQNIGQQEVLNKELYVPHATPEGVFGYQDRYDEYRRQPSSVAGDFRSTFDHWHMARNFSSDPALNSTFVTATPTQRIHQVSTNDVLWIMANHSIQARRMVQSSGGKASF